jgi:hypothetical protein
MKTDQNLISVNCDLPRDRYKKRFTTCLNNRPASGLGRIKSVCDHTFRSDVTWVKFRKCARNNIFLFFL